MKLPDEEKLIDLIVLQQVGEVDEETPIHDFVSGFNRYADHVTMTRITSADARTVAARDHVEKVMLAQAYEQCPFTDAQRQRCAALKTKWDNDQTLGEEEDKMILIYWQVDLIQQRDRVAIEGQLPNKFMYSLPDLLREFEKEALAAVPPNGDLNDNGALRDNNDDDPFRDNGPQTPNRPIGLPRGSSGSGPDLTPLANELYKLVLALHDGSPRAMRSSPAGGGSDDGLDLESTGPPFPLVCCDYCWAQMRYYPFNRCELGQGGTCTECQRDDRRQVCKWTVSISMLQRSWSDVLTGFIDLLHGGW